MMTIFLLHVINDTFEFFLTKLLISSYPFYYIDYFKIIITVLQRYFDEIVVVVVERVK